MGFSVYFALNPECTVWLVLVLFVFVFISMIYFAMAMVFLFNGGRAIMPLLNQMLDVFRDMRDGFFKK